MTRNNDMTKYSLRSWVLVLALAPTILVGILLGSYFTIDRFYELEDSLIEQGRNIIEPLAIASEASLKHQDREASKRLLASAQLNRSPLVKSIAIFDANNQVFVTSHYHKDFEVMRYKDQLSTLEHTAQEHLGDIMVIRTPILFPQSNQTSAINTNQISAVPADNNDNNHLGYIAVMLNKEKALLEQHRSAVAAFIIVLIGVQLNLLFTFRLVKNVTQPITEMVRVVAKIREGKLDTRLEGNLIGELDLLKRGINAMARSLSEYHDEMQQNIDQATSDLRETLEQIEIQNVELDLAKKRALEASRIKSEFLANMSHELRTPLNGVIGFARQLLKTPLHSSQLEYIRTIERSANNLLNIINDILDFSKLEAGKMVLENMPFGLRDLIEDTITLLAGSAREKGLELVIDIDTDVPDNVSGDAMRVGQIITNLVGNAIKFTDKGTVLLKIIVINGLKDKVTLRCEVTDTGIGIDEKHQEMLFQAFGQTDSSISRRFGGTGLGLVITKRLINQMGGQIGFKSQEQQGTTFWFVLPLNQSKYPTQYSNPTEKLKDCKVVLFEPRQQSLVVLEKQLNHLGLQVKQLDNNAALETFFSENPNNYDYFILSNIGFSDEQIASFIEKASKCSEHLIIINNDQHFTINEKNQTLINKVINAPVGEHALAKCLLFSYKKEKYLFATQPIATTYQRENLTVLAVDDNAANLKLIDTLLKELVDNVTVVSSGEKAISEAKQNKFDLIFMDIQMPGTDGITATKMIRKDSLNRNTPIIAVTAHAMAEEREQILGSGMDGYLTKPIDEQALKDVIKRWVTKPNISQITNQSLNWTLCLSQANQKVDLAKEMLEMFLESLPETQTAIQTACEKSDSKAILATVHKLHGASCYCGVPNTQKLCQKIESSLKQGQSSEDLEPEILELLDELTKVESAITKLLPQLTTIDSDDQQTRLFQTP